MRVCGLRGPSVWLSLGTFRPCSQSLVPGPVRLGDLVASGSRGSRAEISVELQVAYAGASCHALFGWLDWLGVSTKLPERKFQSHPGVPPARLIVSALCLEEGCYLQ